MTKTSSKNFHGFWFTKLRILEIISCFFVCREKHHKIQSMNKRKKFHEKQKNYEFCGTVFMDVVSVVNLKGRNYAVLKPRSKKYNKEIWCSIKLHTKKILYSYCTFQTHFIQPIFFFKSILREFLGNKNKTTIIQFSLQGA